MVWVAAGSLGALIIALLFAPAFEVRLTKRVVTPILVGAFLMVVGLVLGNALTYAPASDRDVVMALGLLSGVATGLGLFAVIVACARFAMGSAPAQPGSPSETKP